MNTIPYGHQYINSQDIRAVTSVLKGDWLTQGPSVQAFEEALCAYTGAKFAVAVANGTAGLHLSMLALGIGSGDVVLTSSITFAASANCAMYVGARPDFIDIDPQTCQMDVGRLDEYLSNDSRRRKVKAVVLVHFTGSAIALPPVRKVCRKHGITLVEDAAHAIGADYGRTRHERKVGDGRSGTMAVFSFHPIKNMTTGEGGAIMTNNRKFADKLKQLRHHGVVRGPQWPGWFYDITELGFNYRITDMQCALGTSQLRKLDKMIRARRRLVRRYQAKLNGCPGISLPSMDTVDQDAHHLFVIRVGGGRRHALYQFLKRKNILTQVNYLPVHLMTLYRERFGYHEGQFPHAEAYAKECLSLPLYYGLTTKQQDYVIDAIHAFYKKH